MFYRHLSSNLTKLSVLGLGTVKFGRNQQVKYPDSFDLPSDDDISNILDLCQKNGINVLDTAPAYGSSEERLGQILPGQKDFFVVTKVGEQFIDGASVYTFDATSTLKSIETSLLHLKRDHLDVVLLHSDGQDLKVLESAAVKTLQELQSEGVIGSIGISSKTVEGGLKALDMLDCVMMTYNPIHTDEYPVIEKASRLGKGIFIKKAFASGHLSLFPGQTDPIQETLSFILKNPVTSVIFGSINPQHILHNIECLAKLSEENDIPSLSITC